MAELTSKKRKKRKIRRKLAYQSKRVNRIRSRKK